MEENQATNVKQHVVTVQRTVVGFCKITQLKELFIVLLSCLCCLSCDTTEQTSATTESNVGEWCCSSTGSVADLFASHPANTQVLCLILSLIRAEWIWPAECDSVCAQLPRLDRAEGRWRAETVGADVGLQGSYILSQ